ncbi:MAG: HAD family hydrolase [Chlamydiales bacterium]|nr:HAD family hydrolase [Chlamydiales bacterium]
MDVQAILFDVNGCMIDILTDEADVNVFRKMRDFLHYVGVHVHKTELRELYFQLLKQQKDISLEEHAEFNGPAIWNRIIDVQGTGQNPETHKYLSHLAAQMYRALTLKKKISLYPGVINTLDILRPAYRMAVVTDGQAAYAVPELAAAGIEKYFDPIIVSGDYGYRKPDPRLFHHALEALDVKPENAVFVGNDMYRDVYGAKQVGMKVVFFSSNQGDKDSRDAVPDYIIYQFSELLQAIQFFKTQS